MLLILVPDQPGLHSGDCVSEDHQRSSVLKRMCCSCKDLSLVPSSQVSVTLAPGDLTPSEADAL